MRTLTEITNAVRRGQDVTEEELRYAVVAYDVLIAKLHITQDKQMVEEFFKASEGDPREYIGWVNDPANPEAVDWHTNHVNIEPVIEAAKKHLGD